jgi:hypothetical protein
MSAIVIRRLASGAAPRKRIVNTPRANEQTVAMRATPAK